MTIDNLVAGDKQLSPATRLLLEVLVFIITLLTNHLSLNSKNSSKPPSTNPNRPKRKISSNGGRKAGREKGPYPDEVCVITLDQSTLPANICKEVDYKSRQIFDMFVA